MTGTIKVKDTPFIFALNSLTKIPQKQVLNPL